MLVGFSPSWFAAQPAHEARELLNRAEEIRAERLEADREFHRDLAKAQAAAFIAGLTALARALASRPF